MAIATTESTIVTSTSLADALDVGRDDWDLLLSRSGAASPFLTWAWHRACADAVPRSLGQALVSRSVGGELQALFPFRVHRDLSWGVPVRTLGWAFGDLGCPDHLDLLTAPTADIDELVGALDYLPWVAMRLGNVAEGAVNVERFCVACEKRGWTVRRQVGGRCPYLDLPASWEAYLSGLSAHARHAIRRKDRKLRREHAVALTDYAPARVAEGLDHLGRLHTQRWGGGGTLRDPAMERLHRAFAPLLADRGRLWLVTLDLDGAPAAAWYGFTLGDTVYHYQSGRDPRWERDRVGTVLTGLMIRRAIERGYRTFDFLRGEEPYKAEWTATARRCHEIVVFRRGWRGSALLVLDAIERPFRVRRLRRIPARLQRWLAESWRLSQQR